MVVTGGGGQGTGKMLKGTVLKQGINEPQKSNAQHSKYR